MALIVIQQEVAAGGRREVGQTSGYGARAEGVSVRVGEVDLSPPEQPRRTHGHFPAVKPRAIDSEREEHIGVSDVVVIEVVSGPLMVVVDVQRPAMHRDGQAEQMLLIPLSLQWDEAQPWDTA